MSGWTTAFMMFAATTIAVLLWRLGVKMDRVLRATARTKKQEDRIMADLQPLVEQVNNISGVVDSAVAVLNDVAARLIAGQNDPAEIASIADQLRTKAVALGAAIANVPAEK